MFRTKGILLVTTFLGFPGIISAACPGLVFSALNDTLQSPGFDGKSNYPPNQNCTYDVRVPDGKRIILDFDFARFQIWGNMPSCSEDSLEIIVGCGEFKTSLGKFCSCSNLSMPDKIYTHDHCLTLVFISDDSNEGLGFLAKYTTTDNNETRMDPINNCSNDLVTSSQGTIFSPSWPLKYPQQVKCWWRLSPPSGTIVRLFFTSLDLEDIKRCDTGGIDLVILNGTNTTGHEFKKNICILPEEFFVMMTAVGLHFFANDDTDHDRTGFMAGYATYVKGEGNLTAAAGCWKPPPQTTTTQTTTTIATVTTATKNPPEKFTVGEKVGIGIGAVVGAVIGGILVWYIIRCCKKSEKRKKTETQDQNPPVMMT